MNTLNLFQTTTHAEDGTPIRFLYDQDGDILEIFFNENEAATGIELTDNILLRVNQTTKRSVSLTLINFSILTEETELGLRSFPLDQLDELPEPLRELTLRLVTSNPVNQFLRLSHYQLSPTQYVPLTTVRATPAIAF